MDFPGFSHLKKMKIPRVGKTLLMVILSGIPWLAPAQTQRVTVDVTEADAQTVFTQIKEQTGLNFVYNADQLRSMPRITLRMENATVEAVLEQMFKGTAFEFRFEEGIVIVKRKKQEVKQSVTVSGLVTDKANLPLPGVTVQVMGTSAGTATNENGRFSITLPMTKGKLRFSFVGYRSQEVEFSATTDSLRITLEEEATNIDEVVVTGLFSRPVENYTGAARTFTKEQLTAASSNNLLQALSILDPSVQIAEDIYLGSDPNALANVTIRGGNSLIDPASAEAAFNYSNNPNTPLFILDGFEVSLTRINDLDINRVKSVVTLKDATATTIYGSRAANGVIVIETIPAERGKLRLSYTG